MQNKNKIIIPFILIILIITGIYGCDKKFKESRFLFSTVVDITIISKNKDALDIAFNEMRNVEDRMSLYNNRSETSKINRNADSSFIKVSPDTYYVINRSMEFSMLTDGAFDITVAPLIDIWGFRTGKKQIPSEKDLRKKLDIVNYKYVSLDEVSHSVKLEKQNMEIDLGAIAIGYAVDSSIRALKENGIKSALINAGGEIYALGSPPKRKAWRIGIQHPRRKNELLGTIDLADRAVSTSGDYENYFEINNRRYCHIINARTGKPVDGIMSVTAIADNTTDADALSTALMLIKSDKALALAEKLNIDCMIVTGSNEDDMKILMTKGFRDKTNLALFQ